MHKVNPALNAVVVDLGDAALRAAEATDVALAKSKGHGNDVGPLHGVPVTIKINIDVEGQASSNGVTPSRKYRPGQLPGYGQSQESRSDRHRPDQHT